MIPAIQTVVARVAPAGHRALDTRRESASTEDDRSDEPDGQPTESPGSSVRLRSTDPQIGTLLDVVG